MSKQDSSRQKPDLSRAGLESVHRVEVYDQTGQRKQVAIPGELPLTIRVDGREIVTLMTLGTNPEELALGYLYNQRLMDQVEQIKSVTVDWQRETVEVATRHGRGIADLAEKISRVTVTSSSGMGNFFNCTVDSLADLKLPRVKVRRSTVFKVMAAVAQRNRIYRLSGSVHGCCLCREDHVLMCVEDVGRHNAVDSIAGRMWLEGMSGADKIMFITGRFASEIIVKAALMGIPVLVSKAGVTERGLGLARETGMVVIGRAGTSKFLVYNGGEQVIFD